MSERIKVKVITPESKALKALRLKSGLSLRELALILKQSFSRVHQFESGRDEITEKYIKQFLEATKFTEEDWNFELLETDEYYEVRRNCITAIKKIEGSKLELIYGMLSNL